MEYVQGKHFSITDSKDVNTVVYEINKTVKTKGKKQPKYTVERLDSMEELRQNQLKKTFFVDEPKKSGNQLLFLTFEKEQVTVNVGVLKNDTIKFTKKAVPMLFDTVYKESGEDYYKEFQCTPNMKRPISIIDPATGEEIKPTLYFDQKDNSFKGKVKLQSNKSYLAFQIR